MSRILNWLQHIADGIAVLMLSATFIIFGVQILARYLLDTPLGWTLEVCLTLWLWLIFWAGAFCLKNSDHIRFDILYQAVPYKVQRTFFLLAALLTMIGFAISFLPTWDYILFYKIKKSAVLKIRLDYVFSIYGIFLGAIVMRYGWEIFRFFKPAEQFDNHSPSSAPEEQS
ncbi:MAG: TRAP transporter small permease [Thiolinea sp.]